MFDRIGSNDVVLDRHYIYYRALIPLTSTELVSHISSTSYILINLEKPSSALPGAMVVIKRILLCYLFSAIGHIQALPRERSEPAGSLSYYPSPWMDPNSEWADAYARATDFVSQLTLLEKVNLTTGLG